MSYMTTFVGRAKSIDQKVGNNTIRSRAQLLAGTGTATEEGTGRFELKVPVLPYTAVYRPCSFFMETGAALGSLHRIFFI